MMKQERGKTLAKALLRRAGFELHRRDPEGSFAKRRQLLLEAEDVGIVLDVGGHAGEFGQALRHHGYQGRIVSFEPVADLHERLRRVAQGDVDWSCYKLAVGDRNGEVAVNISGNDGFSSSVLEMMPKHQKADPSSVYVGSETVALATLDEQRAELLDNDRKVFLKVDTQGFEAEVIAGATETLAQCAVVELELGLVELYGGQALFKEMIELMNERGFVLNDLDPGFRDKDGKELLQADALFVRM
ncbi:MAG TPA: FkbM family methyltransferase [Thermoanaerobaculia bacterium]|nr:FkbM family methyltransferase [Thermoanaerobaculia bacterium]